MLLAAIRATLARMQTFPYAPVRLLLLHLLVCPLVWTPLAVAAPAPPKVHVVALGAVRKVPYTPPDASAPPDKPADALTLKVRPLTVDGRQKEWTTGDAHDVTDRSFTIRRALRLIARAPFMLAHMAVMVLAREGTIG